MEETIFDYTNPESEFYYKGFRFEKNENDDYCWYDKKRKLRKKITFHLNGQKDEEIYYNSDGITHRSKGFAYQQWDEMGNVLLQLKMINGKTDKEESIKNEPKVIKEFLVNHFPEIEENKHPIRKQDINYTVIDEIKPKKNILDRILSAFKRKKKIF